MLANVMLCLFGTLDKAPDCLPALDPVVRTPSAIIAGAIPGALSRYYLTLFFARWLGMDFPYGTFFINITGALFMGFFVELSLEQMISSSDLRLLVTVGFLGSYTTFSTYAMDTFVLLKSERQTISSPLLYWLGSAVIGFICLEIGSFLARSML